MTNHYEHKEYIDLTEDYCSLCNVSLSLERNGAIVEAFLTPSGTDTHLEQEVLSEDPEMGLDGINSGESLDVLAAELIAEMGSTR